MTRFGPFGAAPDVELRAGRHGTDRSPSHILGPNGIPAATTCPRLAAAMAHAALEMWRQAA